MDDPSVWTASGDDAKDYDSLRDLFVQEAMQFKRMRENGETFLQKQVSLTEGIT